MPRPRGGDFLANLNPDSLVVKTGCRVEPSLASAKAGDFFQFERVGYFTVDPDSGPSGLVFNRSVSLRDTWGKIEKKGARRRVTATFPASLESAAEVST